MIEDLANIMKAQLESYKLNTGNFPTRILFFRDGVSEGQFQTVSSGWNAIETFSVPRWLPFSLEKLEQIQNYSLFKMFSAGSNMDMFLGCIIMRT